MSRMVGLGNMYGLWVEGAVQKLAQTMSRALEDQVREEWQTIITEVANWEQENMKAASRLEQQVFGPTTFKTQCQAQDIGE